MIVQLSDFRAARDEARINYFSILADLSIAEAALNDEIEAMRARFRDQHADLIAIADKARDIADRAEADLRAAVVESFLATGNKQVDKALKLSVRVNRKLSIADQVAALAWAKANAPMLVRETLDEKAFVKIADTLPQMPEFVKVDEMPVAVIGDL